MTLGKFRGYLSGGCNIAFLGVKILFMKMGFPPLVSLDTSVSRVTIFLMWMVVLLSSSTSLSRFQFGSLYTIHRTLDLIYFVL